IDAEKALEWGMVNRVVPRAELDDTVEEMARTIAQMPLMTIMATKAGIKRAWEMMGMRVHLQQSTDMVALCSGASEVRALMARMGGARPRQNAAVRAGSVRAADPGPPS
ncbi:MAG: Clp protease/crotonase-like domain-containing protein, partial [Acidimicrobiales bacterium]